MPLTRGTESALLTEHMIESWGTLMHDVRFATLVEFISWHGGLAMAERILAEHVCGSNNKCSCSTPNEKRPYPCTPRRAAEQFIAQAPARRPVLTRVG